MRKDDLVFSLFYVFPFGAVSVRYPFSLLWAFLVHSGGCSVSLLRLHFVFFPSPSTPLSGSFAPLSHLAAHHPRIATTRHVPARKPVSHPLCNRILTRLSSLLYCHASANLGR